MTRIVSLVCIILICSASCFAGPKIPVQITSVTVTGSFSAGLPATLTAIGQGFCPAGLLPQVTINGTNLFVVASLCSNTSVTANLPQSGIATCNTLTITNSAGGSANFDFCPGGTSGNPGSSAYGDGSAGPLVINGSVDWTLNPPASTNFQFSSVDVTSGSVWKIPSGLTIRTAGDFTVGGSLIVDHGPSVIRQSAGISTGISLVAEDGRGDGGVGISALQVSQILRPGVFGGSQGQACGDMHGGGGGGTLVLRIGGSLNVTGSIAAKGEDGTVCPLSGHSDGGGGGGGGFVLAAVAGLVNVTGNIDVSGGNGGNGIDGPPPAPGQPPLPGLNGSGGGGGVFSAITPNAPSALGFVSNGGSAGSGGSLIMSTNGGGASGGDGGGSSFGASGAQPGKNGYLIVTLAPTPGLLFQ